MKILKESKEKLPIDFITQFVSKGWDEVGNLKASINGIKKEFSGTKEVEDILQDLVDAYLIAIGQMELHLDKKDYVELPKEEKLKEALEESSVRTIQDGRFDFTDTEGHTAHNNYSNDDIKNKFQGYVYQESLNEAYRNYCVLDVNNNVLYDDYGDDIRKALIDLQNDSRAYSVNRYFTPENDEYVPNSYEDVAYKNKDGKIEIYKNRFYNDEWFNCCSGLDKNKIVLHESNEEDAEQIEAKKFEDENKTEIFTELPDYDVEVEQKGEKIEIELEPKEFDDSKLAMSDEEVARVNEPFDDEWPEPDVSDISDIEDAKASIGLNLVNDDAQASVADNIEEKEIPNQEFNYFIDFEEPEADYEADEKIKAWKNNKNI